MTPASGIRIGGIFGISIYLHPSWFLIFALITLSLRTQLPHSTPRGVPRSTGCLELSQASCSLVL